MKQIPFSLICIFFLFIGFVSYSQTKYESIYTSKNNAIECHIKEIGIYEIKYQLPDEEFIRIIPKNLVLSIKYKNGNTEPVSEYLNDSLPKSGLDWNKVKLITIENEVLGLKKIELVSAKAKGTTYWSNSETVKNRAYSKLLIASALLGADAVYLYSQSTAGSDPLRVGSSTETYLFGVAFTAKTYDFEKFKALLSKNNTFLHIEDIHLAHNSLNLEKRNQNTVDAANTTTNSRIYNQGTLRTSSQLQSTYSSGWQKEVAVSEPFQEDGFIYVKSSVTGYDPKIFRVISFSESGLVLYCFDDKSHSNIILKTK